MEIVKELPTVDYILCPIGGGGLCTGVSTLAKLLNPSIKVIGVEPAGANCMEESLKKGEVVTLPKVNTIADGTAVKTPGDLLFPYIQKNVDDIITIKDSELIVAFLDLVENHKMVAENSGLLTVAALKHLNVRNKKVVSIISGGNMDVITMSSVVQHGLIQRDRIFTVSVLLPDKPGALVHVSSIIARASGKCNQAGAQPVCEHQQERRRGASHHHGGLRHRPQESDRERPGRARLPSQSGPQQGNLSGGRKPSQYHKRKKPFRKVCCGRTYVL